MLRSRQLRHYSTCALNFSWGIADLLVISRSGAVPKLGALSSHIKLKGLKELRGKGFRLLCQLVFSC